MPLPDVMPPQLEKSLTQTGLLSVSLAKEVIEGLESGKPLMWNLILAQQFQSEKEAKNEADH